jgi:hypothetical protein
LLISVKSPFDIAEYLGLLQAGLVRIQKPAQRLHDRFFRAFHPTGRDQALKLLVQLFRAFQRNAFHDVESIRAPPVSQEPLPPANGGLKEHTSRKRRSRPWDGNSSLRMLAGPALVSVTLWNIGFCTFKITKQSGTFIPSTAVVIPSDSQGPVGVILESSTYLMDWVQASPGTYGTSSQLR